MLKEEGISALIRRRLRGPDFLSAGPRDILVVPSFAREAKRILEDTAGLGSRA